MTKGNGKKHSGRGFIRYTAYNFRTKDPHIDELRTHLQDQNGGKLDGKYLKRIHENGGPTVSCLKGWFFGKTRSPWNASLEAAGRAMGLKRVWIKDDK